MKKGLMIAAFIAGAAVVASEIMKKLNNNKVVEEEPREQSISDECENNERKCEVKKTKNHNENLVRVNNSLISIKIKAFSK